MHDNDKINNDSNAIDIDGNNSNSKVNIDDIQDGDDNANHNNDRKIW